MTNADAGGTQDAPECVDSDLPPYYRHGCLHGYRWNSHCPQCEVISMSDDEKTIADLRLQLQDLRQTKRPFTNGNEVIAGQVKEIDRLSELVKTERAKLQAAEQDAARYRWLRDRAINAEPSPWCIAWDDYPTCKQSSPRYGDELDALTDAARREAGERG